ncbi:hypothetical protein [Butyrivibrio sp. JL13D10]|uniref:hypothetical protein n=1 Tax=Butyrivibrio sp. JL13D10 TaxID=3236815 RepID=UPI0038B5F132
MRKKLLVAVRDILFIFILLCCIVVTSLLVERKSSFNKNEMFFREAKKDHIDALILGSSHVINGINPLQLYEEHGFTSYNLGGYGSVLLSSYWQLMLALEHCTPKLVIIDSYMLENDVRYIDDPNANVSSDELHLNIDRFPLSRMKYHAINDMFENQDKKYSYWFDFIVYHDRWKELDSADFKRFTKDADINRMMGAVMEYKLHSAEYEYVDYQAGTLEQETVGTMYLRMILNTCRDRGIQAVVVTVPFLAMAENQAAAHTADKIAAEYGVPSLNMLEVPGIIDFNNDMEDPGHLNVLGCQKVTSYLGNYLEQNFPLTDHREDDGFETWQECLNEYHSQLNDMASGNSDIYTQLMMLKLTGSDKTFAVSIRGASSVYADSTLLRQLKSLGASDMLDKAVSDKCSYFLVFDKGTVTDYAGDGEDTYIETSQGTLMYSPASDIYRVLNINGDTENNYLYSDDRAYTDVQILGFSDGNISSHQYYTCDHFTYDYSEN